MMRGCLRRVVLLVLLLALLAGGWLFRDRIGAAWRQFRGQTEVAVEPSAELADQAERKLDALRSGESRAIALSAIELQSLLQYRYAGALPAFLGVPTITLQEDLLRLRARVPVDKLPRVDELGEIMALLPDTTELAIAARLLPLDSGRIALGIDEASAAKIPLPRRVIPPVLQRIGRTDEPGLPRDAIAVSLPPGVSAAYVRGDSLYLLARAGRTSN